MGGRGDLGLRRTEKRAWETGQMAGGLVWAGLWVCPVVLRSSLRFLFFPGAGRFAALRKPARRTASTWWGSGVDETAGRGGALRVGGRA
jgi:hypothetical protein